jgi:hypothetical protein
LNAEHCGSISWAPSLWVDLASKTEEQGMTQKMKMRKFGAMGTVVDARRDLIESIDTV